MGDMEEEREKEAQKVEQSMLGLFSERIFALNEQATLHRLASYLPAAPLLVE